MNNIYVYDLESFSNFWCCGIAELSTRKIRVFEVSTRKDQREELFDYLRHVYKSKGKMVGFNNCSYDSPLLHHFLKNQKLTPLQLFQHGDKIIKSGYTDNKWQYVLKDKDVILQQIDLF